MKPDVWTKSSFSANGQQCVDVLWRKSTHSTPCDDNCVEVAKDGAAILMRDSKDPDGPVLAFDRGEWLAFLAGVRGGEFDI